MYGSVRQPAPSRVELTPAREPEWGLLQELVEAVWEIAVACVLVVWWAPLVATVVAWAGCTAWAVYAGDYVTGAVMAGTPAVLLTGLWLAVPEWVTGAWSVLVGQWLRVVVYRPRWEDAVLAAGIVARLGRDVQLPRLTRHHHTRDGRDVLVVRRAAGQTLADWEDACASLASTLTAHSVRAREGARPGWVVLDVLRRDPLAGEITTPNPARQPATGVVVLGRDEYGNPFGFDPAATPHAALQGATRSGKSSTCYTALAALAHRADVVVAGVDPSGILLASFTSGRGSGFIATGTRPEDLDHAATVLAGLVDLMDTRIRDLRDAQADKITDYTPAVPVVWVVLEEYPGLLAAAKALDAQRGASPATGSRPASRTVSGA